MKLTSLLVSTLPTATVLAALNLESLNTHTRDPAIRLKEHERLALVNGKSFAEAEKPVPGESGMRVALPRGTLIIYCEHRDFAGLCAKQHTQAGTCYRVPPSLNDKFCTPPRHT